LNPLQRRKLFRYSLHYVTKLNSRYVHIDNMQRNVYASYRLMNN